MKLYAASVPPVRRRLECVASSAASFASGGGGGGGGVGGESSGGGGGGGSDGGDAKANLVASGAQEVSALPSDVIVLDVGVRTLSLTLSIILLCILLNGCVSVLCVYGRE